MTVKESTSTAAHIANISNLSGTLKITNSIDAEIQLESHDQLPVH